MALVVEKYDAVAVTDPMMAEAEGVYVLEDSHQHPRPVVEQVVLVAPSNMPGGYEFLASVNGVTVTVKVPPSGVTQGETFAATIVNSPQEDLHRIPTGRWRSDLCDCLRHGCCSPMFWLAWCCRPLALGQVMTRMMIDASGHETRRSVYWTAFKVLFIVFLGATFVDEVIGRATSAYYVTEFDNEGNIDYNDVPLAVFIAWGIQGATRSAYFFYMLFLTIRTRSYIRNKYEIPEQSCVGCEDCCCSFWFPCCTVLQMAHHTADHDAYPASCCTETGLPPNAPHVV